MDRLQRRLAAIGQCSSGMTSKWWAANAMVQVWQKYVHETAQKRFKVSQEELLLGLWA